MNTYKILSGLKYNGTTYSTGETIEGTAEEFESLVKAGVLKLDDGTEEEEEVTEEAQTPANTWGAQPDVPEVKEEVITADNADIVPTTDAPVKKEGFLAGIFGGKKNLDEAVGPDTVVKTREEMVAELGEEKVAEIEKNAVDITPETTEEVKVEGKQPEITGDNL
jgi:hypothetical protein